MSVRTLTSNLLKLFFLLLIGSRAWGQCSQGSAYADGCPGAPAGTIQYPNALSGYSARPPWNVAGVDYHVGITSGTSLTDWRSLSKPNLSVNTGSGLINCTSPGASITIDAVDFTLGTQKPFFFGGSDCTWLITNSKFSCPGSSSGQIILNGVTMRYIEVDQAGCANTSTFSWDNNLEYSWIKHTYQHVMEAGPPGNFHQRYNLYDDELPVGCSQGQHENFLQWTNTNGGAAVSNVQIQYNFAYHHTSGSGCGEGWQFYCDPAACAFNNLSLDHNTVVALAGTNMSNVVNGGDASKPTSTYTSATNSNNYFGLNSASPYYINTITVARNWVSSCNIDMANGLLINPVDNSESTATGCGAAAPPSGIYKGGTVFKGGVIFRLK